jgi:hypothetical protein
MLSKEVEKSHFFSLVPYVTKPQNRMITDHITREFYGLIVHLFLATFQGSLATLVFSSWVLLCWLSLKYGSEEKGSSLCNCSTLLGFFMSKKTRMVGF